MWVYQAWWWFVTFVSVSVTQMWKAHPPTVCPVASHPTPTPPRGSGSSASSQTASWCCSTRRRRWGGLLLRKATSLFWPNSQNSLVLNLHLDKLHLWKWRLYEWRLLSGFKVLPVSSWWIRDCHEAVTSTRRAGYSLWNSERDIELSNVEWEWVGLCRPGPEIISF